MEVESTAPAALRRPGVTITMTKSGCFAKGGHSHSARGPPGPTPPGADKAGFLGRFGSGQCG